MSEWGRGERERESVKKKKSILFRKLWIYLENMPGTLKTKGTLRKNTLNPQIPSSINHILVEEHYEKDQEKPYAFTILA